MLEDESLRALDYASRAAADGHHIEGLGLSLYKWRILAEVCRAHGVAQHWFLSLGGTKADVLALRGPLLEVDKGLAVQA